MSKCMIFTIHVFSTHFLTPIIFIMSSFILPKQVVDGDKGIMISPLYV